MAHSQRKQLAIGLLVTLAPLAAGIKAFAQEQSGSPATTRSSLVDLLEKRHAVLSRLVSLQLEGYRQGEGSIDAVLQSCQDLTSLELELAGTEADRIEVLEEAVELLGEIENVATVRFRTAQALQADVLMSQAARLNAEIELLRERLRAEKDCDSP